MYIKERAPKGEVFPHLKTKTTTTTQVNWDEEYQIIADEEAEAMRRREMKDREFKYNVLRSAHDPDIYMNR